ncbi:ankyrin repeat domain-containing protein EMB506, chloroplastic-like [Chenopodium quinoa]|uniref:ankyrin repeat domain-containing protein EMB506, chloroplastic-like n=1 Tax=Chenopodium quinoa TaxID=63459 RepID=UPI000B78BB70|nr:ankyrin repeat domain-containing protein EMB506, chloroplastic-like [Chenopodium quinoa]XP_021741444.1 ankyrin repeat domain-containing protein EMB506, chloroplastic-like [Chenopodium quinoa]XP_021741445.1 ankyrin repeat domain-containing protein EMB506, chloroplastic-like [Chenopodium quinoa]
MASWATATLPLKELSLLPVVSSRTTGGTSWCMTGYLKPLNLRRKGIVRPYVTLKYIKGRASLVGSRQSPGNSKVGVWEDPEDGSGSDYDDEEQEAEENDLDFESDWEEDKDSSVATITGKHAEMKYEDELAKEIEHFLEPEEWLILQQNADPNLEKISTAKWSPLHCLALSGQIHFLDQLLENGVNIDLPDKDGLTALHVSIIGKKEAVISHLIRKGANPHIKDKNGVTTLHYAVQVGAIQTVKLLIKYNVDVNASDNEGWTPLHVAMQSRNRDIAKILLVNGADKMRKNTDGRTPLDLSIAYGKDFKAYDLAKLLKMVTANRDL